MKAKQVKFPKEGIDFEMRRSKCYPEQILYIWFFKNDIRKDGIVWNYSSGFHKPLDDMYDYILAFKDGEPYEYN